MLDKIGKSRFHLFTNYMFCDKIIVLRSDFLMNLNIESKNDEMVIALVHYFVTVENYTPIVVRGAKDEVWLENMEGPYRIIRINSNYIHNIEQFNSDVLKMERVMSQIKRKTLSLNINTLNILVNVADDVKLTRNKNIFSIKIDEVEPNKNNKGISAVFPKLANKLIKDKEGIELIVNVTNDINAKTIHDNEVFSNIFKPKKIIITPLLIFICMVMFLLMYIVGNGSEDVYTLLYFGANSQALIKSGEVWRLLTSVFLHIGIAHLVVNMYSLFIIGKQLENFLGKIKYVLVFIISGIVGSLLSAVVHDTVSAGASGAIFGLLGALLYFGYHYRLYLGSVLKSQVIPVILINLMIGFMLPGIDNFAHIGGLAGGYLATMALGIPGKSNKTEQINGTVVLILLVLFLAFMLFRVI